jgi:hypothetical protein
LTIAPLSSLSGKEKVERGDGAKQVFPLFCKERGIEGELESPIFLKNLFISRISIPEA